MSADVGSAAVGQPVDLALFPLQSVLFPGGMLGLKIFETRYLDLMSRCLRSGQGFGVIGLRQGEEVKRSGSTVDLEPVGTVAEILEVDSPQSGILHMRCKGTQRFATQSVAQQTDGLWTAKVQYVDDDDHIDPGADFGTTVEALKNAIEALKAQGAEPFLAPMRFDDAGWVANRWCEILPISLAAKQKLMALDDAVVRLRLVDDYLRSKGVIP